MNQGGIVGLAQMQSPFANSIRPQDQTMGPRSIAPMQQRGFQGPQQMGPMQRNFMQMQNQMRGMQQNPLELYQGYLGQKYIGPMQQEQQNKISQFVGAVNQAEKQAFGEQQGGMRSYSSGMPPMNFDQAPEVMPGGYSSRPAEFDPQGPALMNQGGMMYSDIMNRPMFQTPQQRQGMGIMAGVAPVRGYEEGGMVAPEYTPKFMREEGSEEDGLGRMLFEFFIVDPDDPVDVGLASASAAMVAGGITAPGAVATQLARMGYKGKKLFDAVKKIESLGKPSKPDAGVVRQAMAPVGATYGASQTGRMVGEVPEIVEAVGGIAQLSGGGFLEGLIQSIPGKGGKAIEILSRGIDAGRVAIDDILNALKRGDIEQREAEALVAKADKVLGEAGAETVEQGQRLVLKKPKMQAEDLATPPDSAIPTPPKAPAPAKVADDAAGAAEEAGEAATKKSVLRPDGRSIKRQVATGTGKAAGIAGGLGVASDIGLGTNIISTGLEKIGDAYGAVRDDVAATLEMPEIAALGQMLSPDTGESAELTEKEKADKAVAAQQKPDTGTGTGTPKPEATGIMKFLFGKDGIGGEPGAVGKTMDYLADPRTRYALARAAESRPGVVDRNFFTDFNLGQAEYDQLQGKDETALMQNYEFLKERGKSDDEIFDLLVGKSSQADTLSLFVDLEQEIYDGLLTRPEYLNAEPGADGLTGLQRAARDARIIARQRLSGLVGGQASAPQDSDVTEIPLQPAVQ